MVTGDMNNLRNKIINNIIRIEGGYVDDPDDSGGETKFGITEKQARIFGYTGNMSCLPREIAFDIYVEKYWNSVQGDSLSMLSERITEEVIDTAVNMGVPRAGKFLQRCLNALNDRARLYPDIKVDSMIGPATIATVGKYLTIRDDFTIVKMLNCLQGSFYVVLAERREKDERFIYGWFKNRVKL